MALSRIVARAYRAQRDRRGAWAASSCSGPGLELDAARRKRPRHASLSSPSSANESVRPAHTPFPSARVAGDAAGTPGLGAPPLSGRSRGPGRRELQGEGSEDHLHSTVSSTRWPPATVGDPWRRPGGAGSPKARLTWRLDPGRNAGRAQAAGALDEGRFLIALPDVLEAEVGMVPRGTNTASGLSIRSQRL